MSFDCAFTLQLRVKSQKVISLSWTQRSEKSGKSRFYATCPLTPVHTSLFVYSKGVRWPSFSFQSSPDGLKYTSTAAHASEALRHCVVSKPTRRHPSNRRPNCSDTENIPFTRRAASSFTCM